jgi:hypothetical protein
VARHLLTLGKLVANAAACALVVPLLLLSLLLLLNPDLSPGVTDLLAGWVVLFVNYGLFILVLFPLLVSAVRFFAARPLRLEWFHLKSTVWFLVGGVGITSGIFTFNLTRAGDLMGEREEAFLGAALAMLALCWLIGTALAAAAQRSRGPAGSRRHWIALALLAGAGPLLLLPALQVAEGFSSSRSATHELPSRGGSVLILGIEGASFSEILPLVSEGRLPHLARLLKEGAYGSLATVSPCSSAPAWASLSTGMRPERHGIKAPYLYSMAGVRGEVRHAPAGLLFGRWPRKPWLSSRSVGERDFRASPLWKILDRFRVEASFLGWPLAGQGHPEGLGEESDERAALAREWGRLLLGGAPGGASPEPEADLLREIRIDLDLFAATLRLASSPGPRIVATHLPGLGFAGSRFLAFHHPETFWDVTEEEIERYGHVLERYYEMLDEQIGKVIDRRPEEGYVLILSAYGTAPVSDLPVLLRRLAGLPAPSGGHDSAPAGILILSGPGVAAGRQVDGLRVTDAVPLTLYLLGLPVGLDMDGRLPRRLFHRSSLEANPITFIPGYG